MLCLSSCDVVDGDCVKSISTMASLKHLSFILCHNVKMSGLTSLSTMSQLERLIIKSCECMTDKHKIHIENQLSHVKYMEFVPFFTVLRLMGTRTVNDVHRNECLP